MKSFLVCLVLATAIGATKIDYSGYMVIRVVPHNEEQLQYLFSLERSPIEFWSSPSTINNPVDILVSPRSYYTLTRSLAIANLTHVIRVSDVGQRMRNEERDIVERRASNQNGGFDYENYHRYGELVTLVDEFTKKSQIVTKKVIGTTYEGRDIVMAVVSSNASSSRPIIYMECGMHAREWIAPATCVWILNQLVTNYSRNAEIKLLVDTFDWFITPVSNPDGYEYTWTDDRLWRKNRAVFPGISCVGTDTNRNFDAGFGGEGTSDDPCSRFYHGPSAFSEKETSAMRDLLKQHHGRVKSVLSLHSYSQFWMTPYGYKTGYPVEYKEMYRVMEIGVKALEATYGTDYQYGTIAETIYLASGTSTDYAYEGEGVIYSYNLELRPDASGGEWEFQLPPEFIKPTATETWNGIRAMALAIIHS